MKVKTLNWWQVLDNWRLDVLGDEGSGAPDGLVKGSPGSDTPIPKQCRDWMEALPGFPAVRSDLREWALKGLSTSEETEDWCVSVLVPAVGKGLVVFPPIGPQRPPKKERNAPAGASKGGSLRERGRRR